MWGELAAPEKGGDKTTGPVELATFSHLAERLSPSVVHIWVSRRVRQAARHGWSRGDAFERFFGYPAPNRRREKTGQQEGLGTGIIINREGFILTNNHVVEDAVDIRVTLLDETEHVARLVGAHPHTDLALLKVDGVESLVPAPLGDSDGLRIGEWVMAIGNPLGLDRTVTAGIVSAKGRKELSNSGGPVYADFIQTDASINRGNSGGPLINMRGEVIGINTAMAAAGQGIGFAIPVNMAKKLLPQLARGKVRRSYLGVGTQALTPELAKALSLKGIRGALVSQVEPGYPADKAGLKAGDVIVAFDGREVTETADLAWLAASAGIGRKARVKVIREGRELTVEVTLAAHPDEANDSESSPEKPGADFIQGIGLAVAPVEKKTRRKLRLPPRQGVLVVGVKAASPAAQAGIRKGDYILRFGMATLSDPKSLKRMCNRLAPGATLSLYVMRDGHLAWVALRKN